MGFSILEIAVVQMATRASQQSLVCLAALSCEVSTARFLFCSFALVLLYPSGIDMYLGSLSPSDHAQIPVVESVLGIAQAYGSSL